MKVNVADAAVDDLGLVGEARPLAVPDERAPHGPCATAGRSASASTSTLSCALVSVADADAAAAVGAQDRVAGHEHAMADADVAEALDQRAHERVVDHHRVGRAHRLAAALRHRDPATGSDQPAGQSRTDPPCPHAPDPLIECSCDENADAIAEDENRGRVGSYVCASWSPAVPATSARRSCRVLARRRRGRRRGRPPALALHDAGRLDRRPRARRARASPAPTPSCTRRRCTSRTSARTRARTFVDTNVTGTLNLLEEAVAAGVGRFVFTSTTSAFGRALTPPPGAPAAWVTEDVAPVPRNIYGVTKIAAEDALRARPPRPRPAVS